MRALNARSAFLGPILTIALVASGCEAPSEAIAAGTPPALQRSAPEAVGMSSQRLTRLHDGMQQLVDDGLLAGITTMVARRGQVVDFQTYGHRDVEDPAEDLIFVGMIQQRGGARRPNVRSIAHRLTYQAIIEPLAEMEKNE